MICPNCQSSNAATRSKCFSCGTPFEASQSVDAVNVGETDDFGEPRPHGRNLIASGWALILGGILLGGISALLPPFEIVDGLAWPAVGRTILFYSGCGLFNLGILVWAVGQIVKAISFLPAGKGN